MNNNLFGDFASMGIDSAHADLMTSDAKKATPVQDEKSVREAAKQFESYFLSYMIKAMRKTVEKSDLIGQSKGEEIFQSMLDDETAKNMTESGGIGLADMMVEELRNNGLISGAEMKNARLPIMGGVFHDPLAPSHAPTSVMKGFELPARGVVTSGFGVRVDPFTSRDKFHRGVDIAGERNSPIHAAADGKVVFAGPSSGGYGNLIVVEHTGGVKSYYGHTQKVLVAVGAAVKKGDLVALMGSTGRSTGPHVHFEIRKNGVPVNPLAYLASATAQK